MSKFLKIFKISLQQEFSYRLNFIMWRVRNVIQILIFFFLWNAVFQSAGSVFFGYTKEKILTYALMMIILRAVVLSSRTVDLAGQIANGELSNYLLKPINFFKTWLTRDLASKTLNILFSFVEITFLVIILKPALFWQGDPLYLVLFLVSLVVATFIYFCILMLTSFVPFWAPELSWGAQFLVVVIIVEFLSGIYFPLDVFPEVVLNILKFTPFPYLIFVPIKIYLGALSYTVVLQGLVISLFWAVVLWIFVKKIWEKGLKVYEGVGR